MGCAGSAPATNADSVHCLYQFSRKLGQGSFGQVRLAYHKSSQKECAVKILDLQPQSGHKLEKRIEEAEREMTIWKKIGFHPHVVGLLETFRDQRFCYMVMEKCEYSVLDMLAQKGENCKEADFFRTWRQVLLALQFLHTKNIVHRDVKPANFLVDGEGQVKICDFGLSVVLTSDGIVGIVGTTPFMAPEVVQAKRYDTRVDIWSLGAMAFLMIYGHYPYVPRAEKTEDDSPKDGRDGHSKFAAMKDERQPSKPSKGELLRRIIAKGSPEPKYQPVNGLPEPSALAKGFVEKLLVRNPAQRPSACDCLAFPTMAEPHKFEAAWETHQSVTSMAQAVRLANQAVKQFKKPVDPTVAKSIDALIDQLQREHRNSFAPCFSLPTTNGTETEAPGALFRSSSDGLVSGTTSMKFSHHGSSSMKLSAPERAASSKIPVLVRPIARDTELVDDGEHSTTASSKSSSSKVPQHMEL